ncbi:siderophore iron transporter [Phlyctema vagabunda]|uniref:Siderophore iron transporter n=1 Tax=Phlyctema vagabunda TaxID=108571 RepID=A0ABR4P330_9HELO
MRFLPDQVKAEPVVPLYDEKSHSQTEKEVGVLNTDEVHHSDTDSEKIDPTFQRGVQKVEATTQIWSTSHLIAAYVLIWIISFVDAMQQNMTGQLTPYVTSSFSRHSLTATTSIMSSIIGGLWKLPLAKILDIWGRPQGFALMIFFLTIGQVMMAGCNNVQTYAAAQVFYWMGYNGTSYCISIFVADTSALKNRGFMFAFMGTPYIATVWIGGPLAQAFLDGPGFRWGFGVFSIITPIVTLPLLGLFVYNYRKAKASGLVPEVQNNRTFAENVKFYFFEFDVIGILLLAAGLALFLLPFSLYSYQTKRWESPMIICMIVFGVVFLALFALYEKFLAPVTFIPFSLLTDRTVLGASCLGAVLFIEFYIWDSYFSSFLQAVNGLNITQTSYIVNIYSIGSCFWAVIVGTLIRWTGRYKNVALYFGLPLTMLGVGLMIAFRQPHVNIGYIIMCQIFIAFSGGTLVICEQVAAMAVTSHQYIAVVLAIEGMFSSVGGAIGSTVAAAIWTGIFPEALKRNLPAEAQGDFASIYGSLAVQISYPRGDPVREAIMDAYGEAQKWMIVSATAILILGIPCIVVWRNVQVKDFKQVKGNVV